MKNNRYFTLIELLVVIATLTILMSTLIQVLNVAKEKSDEIKCVENLKQIGVGLVSYTLDSNGYLPSDWNGSNRYYRVLKCINFKIYNDLYGAGKSLYKGEYIPDAKAFQCPSISEYGNYSSFDDLPVYGGFYDMNYAEKYLGNKWLYSSYAFRIYDDSQVGSGLWDKNPNVSYRLDKPEEAMASDAFWGAGRHSHKDRYNILYQDGAVYFVNDPSIALTSWVAWEVQEGFQKMRRD